MMFSGTRRPRTGRVVAAATLTATLLTACGGFNLRREVGLVGNGPDEFRVVTNQRLEMPKALPAKPDDLPEPQPGAPSRVEPTPVRDAQTLLHMEAASGAAVTPTEQALLQRAGADAATPEIRATLDQDHADAQGAVRMLDELLGNDPDTAGALDPAEEARRLAQQAQQTKNPDLEIPAKAAN